MTTTCATDPSSAPAATIVDSASDSLATLFEQLNISVPTATALTIALRGFIQDAVIATVHEVTGGTIDNLSTPLVVADPAPVAGTPTARTTDVTALVVAMPTSVTGISTVGVDVPAPAPAIGAPVFTPALPIMRTPPVPAPTTGAPVLTPAIPVLPPILPPILPTPPALPIVLTLALTTATPPAGPALDSRTYGGIMYNVPPPTTSGPYYWVTCGRRIGIFSTWQQASSLVTGVSRASFSRVRSVADSIQLMEDAIDHGDTELI
ncbi:hypothetical protein BDR06DRAFT_1062187 [Suillus hirtellus]|nr:hypothetical protein BDR06DRAFT_1062187 [Suillus hirtellus]